MSNSKDFSERYKGAPIRIVLADDNEIVRSSLKLFIEANPDFQLVGEAANGIEAIAVCTVQKPDLVLIDISMPVVDGIEATRIIRRRFPEVYILALSTIDDNGKVERILNNGADNYVPKYTSVDDLGKIIRSSIDRNGFNPSLRWIAE
jgi:DNA-binding NarL/FixJ family response regulator